MPLYMDIHRVEGATAEGLAQAHLADLKVQDALGVECVKYWFNESCGKVFCLIHAPNAEAANAVHAQSHGLLAEKIIEVDPEMVEGILGGGAVNQAGAVVLPRAVDTGGGRDPGIRSVLFTDIVGSTDITQRCGDDVAMAMVNVHDGIVRPALADAGGREVKHTGDGIMASFVSAVAAVRCAARIQREMALHPELYGGEAIRVRIGASAGEPVEQRNDLFGSTVQLAARLCAHAEPGQVLVSNGVAELCLGKDVQFDDRGEATLKGFAQPVRVYAVRLAP
jgi:class 3 adenylate cyclase